MFRGKKATQKVLDGAKPVGASKSMRWFEKSGGWDQAKKDFARAGPNIVIKYQAPDGVGIRFTVQGGWVHFQGKRFFLMCIRIPSKWDTTFNEKKCSFWDLFFSLTVDPFWMGSVLQRSKQEVT